MASLSFGSRDCCSTTLFLRRSSRFRPQRIRHERPSIARFRLISDVSPAFAGTSVDTRLSAPIGSRFRGDIMNEVDCAHAGCQMTDDKQRPMRVRDEQILSRSQTRLRTPVDIRWKKSQKVSLCLTFRLARREFPMVSLRP